MSFAVTAKLICTFGFAYADCWFSHEAAHLSVESSWLMKHTFMKHKCFLIVCLIKILSRGFECEALCTRKPS